MFRSVFKKFKKNKHRPIQNIKEELLHNFYFILNKINFQPKHIVDVGANHGSWTREALNYFPDAYYTLVEPQYWLKDSFKDILEKNPKVKFFPIGAGEKSGSFKFTLVDRDDSCTFRISEEEAEKFGHKQVELPILTLNEIIEKSFNIVPDIIKIDAEGLDIEVLRGASSYFGKTEIFMVEAGVLNKYFNNSFFNMINFMEDRGYRLFDITDLNRPWSAPVLWLVELVFIKKNGQIDSLRFEEIKFD